MKVTQFFKSKSALTSAAKAHAKSQPGNWFIRTTLECNHRVRERRKAVILVTGETIVQRLILCNTCMQAHKKGGTV